MVFVVLLLVVYSSAITFIILKEKTLNGRKQFINYILLILLILMLLYILVCFIAIPKISINSTGTYYYDNNKSIQYDEKSKTAYLNEKFCC